MDLPDEIFKIILRERYYKMADDALNSLIRRNDDDLPFNANANIYLVSKIHNHLKNVYKDNRLDTELGRFYNFYHMWSVL